MEEGSTQEGEGDIVGAGSPWPVSCSRKNIKIKKVLILSKVQLPGILPRCIQQKVRLEKRLKKLMEFTPHAA
jgi:hypothetical protein